VSTWPLSAVDYGKTLRGVGKKRLEERLKVRRRLGQILLALLGPGNVAFLGDNGFQSLRLTPTLGVGLCSSAKLFIDMTP
jgi:hypothetical protein